MILRVTLIGPNSEIEVQDIRLEINRMSMHACRRVQELCMQKFNSDSLYLLLLIVVAMIDNTNNTNEKKH